MKIKCSKKGNFTNTEKRLKKIVKGNVMPILDKYGKLGVESLILHTPKESGKTSSLWSYDISKTSTGYSIIWNNDNINKGVNIALILQYGHGLRGGGWIEGIDYINPAIRPIFEDLAKSAWKEMGEL